MQTKNSHASFVVIIVAGLCLLSSCTNNPYRPGETGEDTTFSTFSTPPTKLDPSSAYYIHEGRIIDQIYEPPFSYHYLKRPYELITQTAEEIPTAVYYDAKGRVIEDDDPPSSEVARAEYTIRLKPGIMYQNHPCFAKDDDGRPYYRAANSNAVEDYEHPSDFSNQDTRELKSADYALQIRRLGDPRLGSPIYSTMARYILGMDELGSSVKKLIEEERAARRESAGDDYNQELDEKDRPINPDYMSINFPGFEVIDDHTFKIVLKRKYPQILYWMCMHFFAPMPQEVLDFYAEPAIAAKEFSVMRYPVGTGPYYMKKFRPNEVMILEANPNYREDYYPSEGAPGDGEAGLLADAGKRIPFIKRQVYKIEKESIPAWNKFLQGYYDSSGINSDVFDQAIQIQVGEDPSLSDVLKLKNIRLITDVDTTFWYTAFNMHDPEDPIAGYSEEKCKIRQAISIALDYNEYLDIFQNGRGVLGQGPLPPGIFGYRDGEAGTNPYCDQWNSSRKRHDRKSIEDARKLMVEAGYPGGIGPDGEPLTLNYDHSAQADTMFRSYFDWASRKLKLIGVRIKDRGTDLSRYRQKRKQGNWQVASGGWLADYPDPENFLFLFYGPNSKVASGGANAVNYSNAVYDALFEQMETMVNSPERQAIIDKMMNVLQHDAPAVWQFHPVSYGLLHEWYKNGKPHQMSYNVVKYRRIDPLLREKRQLEWNEPVWWPVLTLIGLLILGSIPAAISVRRRERGT